MPIWSEILAELAGTQEQGNPPDFDGVRRKYLAELHRHTGRNIILYASGWLQNSDVPPALISISDEDMQALMEVSQMFNWVWSLRAPKLSFRLRMPNKRDEFTASPFFLCPHTGTEFDRPIHYLLNRVLSRLVQYPG